MIKLFAFFMLLFGLPALFNMAAKRWLDEYEGLSWRHKQVCKDGKDLRL